MGRCGSGRGGSWGSRRVASVSLSSCSVPVHCCVDGAEWSVADGGWVSAATGLDFGRVLRRVVTGRLCAAATAAAAADRGQPDAHHHRRRQSERVAARARRSCCASTSWARRPGSRRRSSFGSQSATQRPWGRTSLKKDEYLLAPDTTKTVTLQPPTVVTRSACSRPIGISATRPGAPPSPMPANKTTRRDGPADAERASSRPRRAPAAPPKPAS